jgi:DNA-binding LacI/PurR family transcriptional regulator
LASSDHALLLRVLDSEGPVEPSAYARLARSGRVDGFLLSDVEAEDPRLELLAETGLPVVVAGRPPSTSPFPAVETRHADGLAAATAHLIARGHERIGFLGGQARFEFEQARLAAWRGELARAGLEPGPVAFGDAGAVLDEAPTAIVCTSDVLAAAALAGGHRPAEFATFTAYLVSVVLLPVAGLLWARTERTRWAGTVLGVAALTVAVMVWRLVDLWEVTGG